MTAPAGWYPDPAGQPRRRYWDGQQWTDHYTDFQIVTPGASRTVIGWSIVLAALILIGFISALAQGDQEAVKVLLPVVLLGAVICAPIWLAFRSDKRRQRRQQQDDRHRAWAINADLEDEAYRRGDDERGIYGQFPPAS